MSLPQKLEDCAVDIDYSQKIHDDMRVCGDMFVSTKQKEHNRVMAVLSDGLGSGVKAGVLACLTATMGINYIKSFRDPAKAAKIIMETLPVCSVRKISYSTFSMIDIDFEKEVRMVEYDNPPALVLRMGKAFETPKEKIAITRTDNEPASIDVSCFKAQYGDRIVVFSDGVTQSGIGSPYYPFGWGIDNVRGYIEGLISSKSEISAHELSKAVVKQAWLNNGGKAYDDITCGVIHFRRPRRLLILTGPPYNKQKDHFYGSLINEFEGKKIICGGTTANIVSRETGREITVKLDDMRFSELPPESYMEGADLVTEGILTLGRAAKYLEERKSGDIEDSNPAAKIVNMMLESDIISFVVGTRINEFHQDPNMPVDLEIRRNVIKKMADALEKRFSKEVSIQYI